MVNYYIYAKDYSASTSDVKYYHENGLKTVKQFKSDIETINNQLSQSGKATESRIIYLHWGSDCEEVNEETIIDKYEKLYADGSSTLPELIIEWIQQNIDISDNNSIKLLYIITDGLIYTDSMNTCLELNRNMHYENVVFYAFHQNENQIDLSVAASFLKSYCKIYCNSKLLDDIDISEDFDYDKIQVDNFATEKENLKSYIRLKYINTSKNNATALKEIDKLKKLRNRLFVELSSESRKNNTSNNTKLNTTDKNVFLQEFCNTSWYKNLNVSSHDVKVEIEKAISTLINYIVSDKKSYAFDALKFETKFNNDIEEEEIVDVNFTPEQEIEFPDIILDDDKGIPVILLTQLNLLQKIIFHSTSAEVLPASFSKFKSTMECPLFLINDSDISESIGYFYTLNVYKQLLEKTTKTEPRTRKPFHGGLVLVDSDEFDKYNDYILVATYFNFKKVNYNVGLFYFVLWKICEKKEWMDKNVIEQFKKYVMRRISTTVCKIGLSSLPLDPQENTSLLTALWYCVELSSHIFKEDPQNFTHERLRMYYGVAHSMIEILQYFNYNLDLASIESRRDLITHVMTLKRIQTHTDKVYYLLEKIFKKINGFLVCEIENPCNLNKLNYLKLNHKGMLCDDIIKEKVHLNDYVHLMHCVDILYDSKNSIKMCEKTFRPFFTIDQNKSFYTELFKIIKKVVIINDDDEKKIGITFDTIDSLEFSKILSLYNLFINCVKDNNKYPTLDEYMEYIIKKKKFNGDLITIFPLNCYDELKIVYLRYENIMKNVDVNEFIQICNNYVKRFERIKAEGIQKFDYDEDIDKFISSEELKIKLKKIV